MLIDPKDRKYYLLGLRIAGDFGATIAAPEIVFVLVGQWLDGRYYKAPWLTIASFILAALLSGRMIYKKAKRYGKQFDGIDKKT